MKIIKQKMGILQPAIRDPLSMPLHRDPLIAVIPDTIPVASANLFLHWESPLLPPSLQVTRIPIVLGNRKKGVS